MLISVGIWGRVSYDCQMEIDIAASDLGFLKGDIATGSHLPVKVMRAARLRLQLIKAIPEPDQMKQWKSLDYKSVFTKEKYEKYSISVIGGWRMYLHNNSNISSPGVTVIGLEEVPNG